MTAAQAERLIAALERIADYLDPRTPEEKAAAAEDAAFKRSTETLKEWEDRKDFVARVSLK